MRTRRSPRNQEILWRALGGSPTPKPAEPEHGVAYLERQLAAAKEHCWSRTSRRMVERELAKARLREADAAGGILVRTNGDYATVTFAERPERDTLAALRAAGFHWSAPSWHGRIEALQGELASLTGHRNPG